MHCTLTSAGTAAPEGERNMRYAIWALGLLLAGCSSERASFRAGQWEFSIEASAAGQRVFWGGGGQCVKAMDASELPVTILSGTAFGHCTSTSASFAGGRLSMSATCDGKSAATTMSASKVSLQGTSTESSFESTLSARLEGDSPVKEMSGKLSAHRTGECANPQQVNAS
jgi:hypothetical protein